MRLRKKDRIGGGEETDVTKLQNLKDEFFHECKSAGRISLLQRSYSFSKRRGEKIPFETNKKREKKAKKKVVAVEETHWINAKRDSRNYV